MDVGSVGATIQDGPVILDSVRGNHAADTAVADMRGTDGKYVAAHRIERGQYDDRDHNAARKQPPAVARKKTAPVISRACHRCSFINLTFRLARRTRLT